MQYFENHPPSGCFQFDVQKCPVALEALDDFQPLSPTLGTHTCPCQWNWWKFCLKKVCSIELAPICFPSCITKCLFTFFFFSSLCPAWTINPLSHFAFISNQFHSLVHWLAQSFITLRYQKEKMPLKPLKMLKFICLNLQCFRGCPLIWWIPWVLCMCVFLLVLLAAMGYMNSCSPLENRAVWSSWCSVDSPEPGRSPGWDVMAEMLWGNIYPHLALRASLRQVRYTSHSHQQK